MQEVQEWNSQIKLEEVGEKARRGATFEFCQKQNKMNINLSQKWLVWTAWITATQWLWNNDFKMHP